MQVCLAAAREVDETIDTELIELADRKIGPCIVCNICKQDLICGLDDDFGELIPPPCRQGRGGSYHRHAGIFRVHDRPVQGVSGSLRGLPTKWLAGRARRRPDYRRRHGAARPVIVPAAGYRSNRRRTGGNTGNTGTGVSGRHIGYGREPLRPLMRLCEASHTIRASNAGFRLLTADR